MEATKDAEIILSTIPIYYTVEEKVFQVLLYSTPKSNSASRCRRRGQMTLSDSLHWRAHESSLRGGEKLAQRPKEQYKASLKLQNDQDCSPLSPIWASNAARRRKLCPALSVRPLYSFLLLLLHGPFPVRVEYGTRHKISYSGSCSSAKQHK